MWVYLSGDENCLTWANDTIVEAGLSYAEASQDLTAGNTLLFNIDDAHIPVDNVLCENAQYVCAQLRKGDNPSNDFTLVGIPDESALVGSYPLDCRGKPMLLCAIK